MASINIAIIGLGGLGCSVANGLIRLGVKNLTLIDPDIIQSSNIPRQILFNQDDVGQSKVQIAKKRLLKIFDGINILIFEDFITNKTGPEYLKKSDLVIDCTDNYLARHAISKSCKIVNKPMIYGGVEKFEGQVGVFNLNGSSSFHESFPNIQDLIKQDNCSSSGVLPFVVQHIANIQVIEAYKIICNEDNILTNQLLCINVLSGKQRIVNLKKTNS